MPTPESQLETWSHQGSVTQSKETYAAIRRALEVPGTGYANKSFSVFLQGSYCNDTNIYSESDVDVVMLTDSTYYHDLGNAPEEQKAVFWKSWSAATYSYGQFKSDVVAALRMRFGDDVFVGNKAITIRANGGRRKADVIVAMEFRLYFAAPAYSSYYGTPSPAYHKGICFFTAGGDQIVNYPIQHSANLTSKHQATQGWFKPCVRILKNVRNRLIEQGALPKGIAPSYFLEGLLYNVPNSAFRNSYQSTLIESIRWLRGTDATQLVCANERYYLVRDGVWNCWPVSNYNLFLSVLAQT